MSSSSLFELRPDPYDDSQRKFLRVCLFVDVENAQELKELVSKVDVALIRSELVLEPFVLLSAANRAVFSAAHNRLITRSLSAELIYSLSPHRNINESLATFGIKGSTRSLLACCFDDAKGKKMKEFAKKIKGIPVSLEKLRELADETMIKQIYHLSGPELNNANLADLCVTRIVSKDLL